MSQTMPKEGKNRRNTFNLALAAVAGQVGCLTTLIVVVSLLVGLFIDSRLDTRPTFTIILVILSVPVTLATMFWVVRNVTSKIKSVSERVTESLQEDTNRGTDD
jgi:F0F1-type ATP synthase assembly protein I